jgi:hypothetical protein
VSFTDISDLPDWAPTVQDIADLSPAYTRHAVDAVGAQAGAPQKVFDDSTDPTATDVQAVIYAVVREVTSRVGMSPRRLAKFGDLARQTVIWGAAAEVEAEKQPQTAAETVGAYAWKQASYVSCLKELTLQARTPLVR